MTRLQRFLNQIQALLAQLMGIVMQGAAFKRQVDQIRKEQHRP